ncbi:MAG: hypothetical protein AB8H47_04635 [Bacteroidia bacterium]
MQSPYIEQIDAYLRKQLSPEAQLAFEQALEDDASLADALKQHLEALVAIRQKGFQSEIAETESETKDEAFVENVAKTRRLTPLRIFLVAASITLVAMLSWWVMTASQNDAEKLFAAHFYAPAASDLLRGGAQTPADSLPTPLVEGLQAYQKGAYSEAIVDFSAVPKDQLTAFERSHLNLLSGISYLVGAEYDSAQLYFQTADMHVEAADWYLALSYFRAKDFKTARELLSKIANDNTHEFQLLAQKLLADLD